MTPEETELVDVVNERGEVLEVVEKHEAHERGLLHKTVVSEVIDSQGRWLLVRQSNDRQDPGQYVSPMGGHVMAGETEDAALRREVAEELDLRGDYAFDRVGGVVLNRYVLGRQENHFLVVYKIYSDAPPVLNEESESYSYFTESELRSALREHPELFGKPFLFLLEKFFPHLLK